MNGLFLVGGGLALFTAALHLWGGETTLKHINPTIFPPTAQGDGVITKQELRFGWHIATVDFLFGGLLLLLLALTDVFDAPILLGRLLAVYFAGYAALIFVLPLVLLRRVDTVYRLPQWIICGLLAALAYGGTLA